MEKKILGKTALKISPIGFGTIQLTNLDLRQCENLIHETIDSGINWFDTARDYFNSEKNLGYAVNRIRDKVVIITKSQKLTPNALRQDIEKSLRDLKTDYIDIFLFHKGNALLEENFLQPNGLLETAVKEVEKGKIRYLGFSAHSVDNALKGLDTNILDVALIPVNFISREFVRGNFLEKAKNKNVAVLGMKPFGGGRIPNIHLCIQFLKRYPDIFPCIGMKTKDELKQNIDEWNNNNRITYDDIKAMFKIRRELGKKYCRGCGYCLPCPEKIDIPLITFLKMHIIQLPYKEIINESVMQEVEKAKGCINCRKCVNKCPFTLNIPEMLKENIKLYNSIINYTEKKVVSPIVS